MNRNDWKPRQRLESGYLNDIVGMLNEAMPAFGPVDANVLDRYLARLRDLALDPDFRRAAEFIAKRMVTGLGVANARDWRQAAARSMRGAEMLNALREELVGPVGIRLHGLITENARLIRSIPADIAELAAQDIMRAQQAGRRSSAIAEMLRARIPGLAMGKAKLIARTQVASSETSLTEARAEAIGIRWYEWKTSEDQRVRPAHRNMDRVLVNFGDKPSPELLAGRRSSLGRYNAGQAPNCRCVALPLVRLDEVKWPHRVYYHGGIEMMARTEFARLAGILERRAA